MLNFPSAPTVGQTYAHCVWDGEKWTNTPPSVLAPPSAALPPMSSTASPGDDLEYARDDHVHPSDTSRAPKVAPSFTGGIAAAALTASGLVSGNNITANNGRLIAQMGGSTAQPSVAAYSLDRAKARGIFLDTANYLAFGDTDANGVPTSNVARIDGSGNWTFNGTITLGRDPTADSEAATKSYVDARASSGAYLPLAGGTLTGLLYPKASPGTLTQPSGSGAMEVYGAGGDANALMTFHRVTAFAVHFGLNTDHNFWYGGLSFGAGVAYRFWTSRDCGQPATDHRMAFAGDYAHTNASAVEEPWGGYMTGLGAIAAGPSHTRRYRYVQLLTTSWFSVGFA